jgi:hypothetical protein
MNERYAVVDFRIVLPKNVDACFPIVVSVKDVEQ